MNTRKYRERKSPRRAATLIFAMVMLMVILGMVAFAVDVGYMMLLRTQLQVAADSAATAAAAHMGVGFNKVAEMADRFANYHAAGGKKVALKPSDVELGLWDFEKRTFTPTQTAANAVRVTARRDRSPNGEAPLFFGRICGLDSFDVSARAVAMANPRDIAFVVDLSGSMNDDTEPCWATGEINETFGPEGYPTVGTELIEQVFEDFGFGAFPGRVEYLGKPWGVKSDKYAYAELTKDGGPLGDLVIPEKYRIHPGQNESVRKKKAYSAIIELQIARLMPDAKPAPNSSNNYDYWEKYLDYIIEPVRIEKGKAGTPSENRGWLPPDQDTDRIDKFNNPNNTTFPGTSITVPRAFRNWIGYVTYVQFMMDHGRDLEVVKKEYAPLSKHSPHCPWHSEATAGGAFKFPPRAQPEHAARRALIAAIQVVKERNGGIADVHQRDWVSIVAFDTLSGGGPVIEQLLTVDYDAAMKVCTGLQAVGDKGASTATESGMIVARDHIKPVTAGGQGRQHTNKVVVLLTDGVPNLYSSSIKDINKFMSESRGSDFYNNGAYWLDAPLMQAAMMQENRWCVFPVGVGLGTDYGFMDRLAHTGGTADDDGLSPRGSGNPAEYERRLTDIFEEIITNPQVRLVQ